ncbi:MAG TPA: hypothetical protein VLU73_09930 [Methylococcaceae bacterium]|jgi:uncharacterized membrane protein|nr:hypothetical protein [Methylococcaceae bacterium]
MNKYFTLDKDDKTLWLGILAVSAIAIVIFSLFHATSPLFYLTKILVAIFEMFLPGYVIMKLFLDRFQVTDNRVVDRAILSVGLSMVTVQVIYFLSTYLRTYAFNVDEDVISSNAIAIVLVFLVIGAAFGAKFYLNKKKGVV